MPQIPQLGMLCQLRNSLNCNALQARRKRMFRHFANDMIGGCNGNRARH